MESLSTRLVHEHGLRVVLGDRAEVSYLCGLQTAPTLDVWAGQVLNARAFPPLAHCVRSAVFAPRGARPPSLLGFANETILSAVHISSVLLPHDEGWTPSPEAGWSRAPTGSDGGALPPTADRALGCSKNAGAFFQSSAPPAFGSTRWGGCDLRCCAAPAACTLFDALRAKQTRLMKLNNNNSKDHREERQT